MNHLDKIRRDVQRSNSISSMKKKYLKECDLSNFLFDSFVTSIIVSEEDMEKGFSYYYDNSLGWYRYKDFMSSNDGFRHFLGVKGCVVHRDYKKKISNIRNKIIENKWSIGYALQKIVYSKNVEFVNDIPLGHDLLIPKPNPINLLWYNESSFSVDDFKLIHVNLSTCWEEKNVLIEGNSLPLSQVEYLNRCVLARKAYRLIDCQCLLKGGNHCYYQSVYDCSLYDEENYDYEIDVDQLTVVATTLSFVSVKFLIDFKSQTVIEVDSLKSCLASLRSISTGKPITIVDKYINFNEDDWSFVRICSLIRFKKKNYLTSFEEVVSQYNLAYDYDDPEYAYERFIEGNGPVLDKVSFYYNVHGTTRVVTIDKDYIFFKSVFFDANVTDISLWKFHHILAYYAKRVSDFSFIDFMRWFIKSLFSVNVDYVFKDLVKVDEQVRAFITSVDIALVRDFFLSISVMETYSSKLLTSFMHTVPRERNEFIYYVYGKLDQYSLELMREVTAFFM